jgi:hypothetical protein
MNHKLIDSLVQIISSLTPEERQNLEKKLASQQLSIQQSSIFIKDDPCVGMWKDREDLQDSSAWVRQIRKQEWMG